MDDVNDVAEWEREVRCGALQRPFLMPAERRQLEYEAKQRRWRSEAARALDEMRRRVRSVG